MEGCRDSYLLVAATSTLHSSEFLYLGQSIFERKYGRYLYCWQYFGCMHYGHKRVLGCAYIYKA